MDTFFEKKFKLLQLHYTIYIGLYNGAYKTKGSIDDITIGSETTRASLSSGVYSNKPKNEYLWDGYCVITNTDSETKGDYPWMIVEGYKITYKDTDGSEIFMDDAVSGFTSGEGVSEADFAKAVPPAPAGKMFAGWYTAPTGGTMVTEISTEEENDVVVYAHYVDIPIPSIADITSDSGYYADSITGSDKSGIIAFTSVFSNLATDLKDYTFGAEDKFGIVVYKAEDGIKNSSFECTATDFDGLMSANSYFYSFVNDIEEINFGKSVYAIPYAKIAGTTYWGNIASATVNTEKWLGNKAENSPVGE